jgi:hypothetical protein
MKTAVLFTFITGPLCCLAIPADAALLQRTNLLPALPLSPPSLSLDQARTAALPWQAKSRNAYQTEWTRVERRTNAVTGRVVEIPHAFVEVGAGLNRKDATGRWVPADPSFEITERGAEARFTAHRVLLAPDIASPGAVQVEKDGVALHCHPLCIGYYDPVDGRSVALAEITNAVGWIVASNVVVFSNCFDGLRASIRYRNSRAGLESDLLLHAQPPPPPPSFSPRTRLELFTEFVGDTPTPRLQQRVLQQEQDAALRGQMVEPDFADSTLDFGAISMGPGRAFLAGTNAQRRAAGAPIQVGKRYQVIDGRRVLIEAVEWSRIQRLITNLPAASVSGVITNAALRPGRAGLPGQPPETLLGQDGAPSGHALPTKAVKTAALRSLPTPRASLHTGTRMQMLAASAPSRAALGAEPPTFVLDWEAKGNESASGYTFEAGATYRVTGPFTLSGTTTFSEGACIKFDTSGSLQIQGPVYFQGSQYRAIIFTGTDDDSLGEILPGSTGAPWNAHYGTPMLYISPSAPAVDLSHFHMAYANQGIWIENGSQDNLIRHAQIVHSWTPIYLDYVGLRARNVLAHDVDQFFLGGWPAIHGEHLTVHTAFSVADGYTPLYLTNSLVVNTDDTAAWYTTDHSQWHSEQDAVFQTVGAGSHYLAEPSLLRDAGSPAIDPVLLADLQLRTTYPPTALNQPIVATTVILDPIVLRDNNGMPDLGYHYDPLDYLVSGLSISESTVIATNGVAIGLDYSQSAWGLVLNDSTFVSEGSPLKPNRLLRTSWVYEDPVLDWGAALFYDSGYEAPPIGPSELRFRFTELAQLPGDACYFLYNYVGFRAIEWSHCSFYNPLVVVDTAGNGSLVCGSTNTLWQGGASEFGLGPTTPGVRVDLRNNLFRQHALHFVGAVTGWTMRDNVFESAYVDDHGVAMHHCYNGYFDTTRNLVANGANDVDLEDPPFLPGTLASLPTDSPLIDAGSQCAAGAGLYHFTTTADQVEEGNSVVDIGLHAVALNGAGQPIDSDTDGVPDVIEDPYGHDPNRIQSENALTGTEDWKLTNPAKVVDPGTEVPPVPPVPHGWPRNDADNYPEIEGFADQTSVNVSGTIDFYVDVRDDPNNTDPNFMLEIYRMGWYGGLGGRTMTWNHNGQPATYARLHGARQPVPQMGEAGVIDCLGQTPSSRNWVSTYSLVVPSDWVSGVYLAKLTTLTTGKQSYIIFIVREDSRSSDFLFQCSVTTYQAYNPWGGNSFYSYPCDEIIPPCTEPPCCTPASAVSFNRPYAGMPFEPFGYGLGAGEFFVQINRGWLAWEYNMARWLERQGYDVTYSTSIDTHRPWPASKRIKTFLSVGHDEYWSPEMRSNVSAARGVGVNLAFFSANSCWNRILFDSAARQFGYIGPWRGSHLNNSTDYPAEIELIGVEFVYNSVTSDMKLRNPLEVPLGRRWFFDHIQGLNIEANRILTGLLGYELDGDWEDPIPCNGITGAHPRADTVILADSTFPADPQFTACPSSRTGHSYMTIYTAPSAAQVFATGSMDWNWGLDNFGFMDGPPLYFSSRLNATAQQMTHNLLRTFAGKLTAPVTFTNADANTAGDWSDVSWITNWKLANWTPDNLPNYASSVTVQGHQLQVWPEQANDPRALLQPGSPTERIAAAWTTSEAQNSAFTIDVNLTDGSRHQIALYCVDWFGTGTIAEKIEVFESTDTSFRGALDTRQFILPPNGVYLVWKLDGHKIIRVAKPDATAGNKAMVSGIFFEPPPP